MDKYGALFTPVKIGNMTLKNRLVMSPMTTRLGGPDNQVTERMIDYFVERARGGVAMITTEAFYVAKRFAGPNTVALDSNEKIPMLASLCEAVQAQGARICVQLGCGLGRYDAFGKNGEPPKTSSAIPTFAKPDVNCTEMTVAEIQQVVKEYERAARQVLRAGGDAVNIHGHNGYLIDQFMTEQFNTRTDEYGGSLEKRMRYPLEIVAAVRKAVGPGFPIIFRFSVDLCFKDSRGMEESMEMLKMLQNSGIDALDLDTGATESMDWIFTPYFNGEACELYVAEAARKAGITLPLLNSGAHNPDTALAAVNAGTVDCVMMGRALVADPQLPNKLMLGIRDEIRPCLRCNEFCSKRALSTNAYLTCAVNAAAGYEARFLLTPASAKKKIAVIGAGPAGMEAARVAAVKGHSVTVYEKNGEAAVLMKRMSEAPFKAQTKRFLAWQESQLKKLGVTIVFGKEIAVDSAELKGADALIVATGAVAAKPAIPGMETTLDIRDAYCNKDGVAGETVVIAGGNLSACELALELAARDKKVTLVEKQKKIASDCYGINKIALSRMLREAKVDQKPLHTVTALKKGALVARNEAGEEVFFAGDVVINALGSTPALDLAEALRHAYPGMVYAAGSCEKIGSLRTSVRSGYFTAFPL